MRANLALLTLISAGCGGIDPSLEEGEDALVGGRATFARPEVGLLETAGGLCTATLIRADVAITAAHCVDFETRERASGYFHVFRSRTDVKSLSIDRYVSLSRDLGDDDVALVHLERRVPASVATPARLATREPEPGESMTSFGFGCTDRDDPGQEPKKRRVRFDYLDGQVLCPGDSGGPGFLRDGTLALIHSAYRIRSGLDIHASVALVRPDIDRTLGEW
ncbi:MAG: S1 family peptidase [Deltaproteobacteria bacterium]|nr:S1 family peptidase [Deltaproteobacteria bacterium]